MSNFSFDEPKIKIAQADTSSQELNSKYYCPFSRQIGLTQFHSIPIINNRKITYLSHTIIKKLSSQRLQITDFYIYWRWEYLFKSVKKMDHLMMEIYEPYYKNVLRDIAGVEWSRLKKLRLNLTNSSTIEAIGWLDCPNLQEIDIIVRVRKIKKEFAKGWFPKLRIVNIQCDGIDQIEFGRTLLKNGEAIHLDVHKKYVHFNRADRTCVIEDFSYLSKVGLSRHLGQSNCDQKNELQNKPNLQRIQILNSMKKRMLNGYKSGENYNTEYKNQRDKIVECLLERKFQVVIDQQQQQMQIQQIQQ